MVSNLIDDKTIRKAAKGKKIVQIVHEINFDRKNPHM